MVYLPPPSVFQPLPITSITLISHHRILLEGWKEAPPPKSPKVAHTLKRHEKEDVEGLLAYYDLPLPLPLPLPHDPVKTSFEAVSLSWPEKVKFELHTLPVDAKSVGDGDTITVYVDTLESSSVPRDVQVAAVERSKALASKNYAKANALQKYIVHAGYRAIKASNEEILAQKYRVRLRGIDAPESSMPYGKEAKGELLKLVQGKCLEVHVFGEDRYGRYVGDVYCNGVFVQEWMLRKGFAWHYTTYDQRSQLASWEKQARTARVGLWASTNPEKPWEWRKNQREGRKVVNL